MDTSTSNLDSLDDTTPLPELSFDDLLEPPTTKLQQMAADDSDESTPVTASDSLNTPRPKKGPTVQILENRRLTPNIIKSNVLTSIGSSGIKFIAAPTTSTTATTRPIVTDVQGLSKTQPMRTLKSVTMPTATVKISSGTGSPASKTLNLTQIKTADGRVIYLQKAPAASKGGTTTTVNAGAMRMAPTSAKPLSLPPGIQKAVVSKGVTIAATGLVKAAAPINTSKAVIKGTPTITTTTTVAATTPKKSAADSNTPTLTKVPIQVVRTADGKLIKLNHVLSTTKPATPPVTPAPAATTTTSSPATSAAAVKVSPNNVMLTKKVLGPGSAGQQMILKTPVNQLSTDKATTVIKPGTSSPTGSVPAGKMLLQSSTGKQIVVSNKNIIKLSPKPTSTTGSNNSNTLSGAGTMHAVQLPGKSVQYVRVVPNNNSNKTATSSATTPNSSNTSKVLNTATPKLTVVRPSTSVAAATAAGTPTKFVVKQSGGNIVPLNTMQSLLAKSPRSLSSGTSPTSTTPTSNVRTSAKTMEPTARKHKLSDLNMQLKELGAGSGSNAGDEASDSSDTAPESKKPRYVLMMQKGGKMVQARPTVQRVANTNTTAGSSSSGPGSAAATVSSAGKKVYNLVKTNSANGVKYMICNTAGGGVPRTLTSAIKRPQTLADAKQGALGAQQLRLKHLKAVQQRQQQQQQQRAQQSKALAAATATATAPQQQPSSQTNTSASKSMPPKPLFDILKPAAPIVPATPPVDALAGLASRRKHCNCSKSQCLKLYCDCFANGEFCQDCTCKDCFNNLEYEGERQRAIRSCLDRNPSAFKPKITARDSGDMRLHNKGCNCKRSGCLKNYCECYEAKIPCSSNCKCVGCRNMEDRPDVDLDSLDGMSGKVAGKGKAINGALAQDARPNVYLTDDVIGATIMCMISRIVMHEKQNLPIEVTEREVLEELGESLSQIILFAKEKNDTSQMDESKVA